MFKNQPKLDIRPTANDRSVIRIGWIVVVINFILVMIMYFKLPETIPIHFNLRGEADGYGNKSAVWILPIANTASYILMSIITIKAKPWNFNYPTKVTEKNAPRLYAMCIQMMVRLNFGIALMFLIITLIIVLKAMQFKGFQLGWTFIPLIGSITLFPFWYIYKMFKVPKE